MQIVALMQTQLISALPELTTQAALQIMREHRFHHFPIVDDACTLIGVVSESDLLAAMGDERLSAHTAVRSLMTPDPVTITPHASVQTAARMMVANQIRCLPVVEGDTLVGIVTATDLLRHLGGLPSVG